ncbi:MAG: tetratricopeptide repeat protein [Deltaproteobacteria bacterium]|nr:tetratricopeptide repeat protein [Deltaproteobacteria bacterium]
MIGERSVFPPGRGCRPALFILAASLSVIILQTSIASGANNGRAVPFLDLYRPAGKPGIQVAAFKSFGSTRIPYADATVFVVLPDGGAWFGKADLLGRCEIPARVILPHIETKSGPATLRVALSLNGTVDEKRITVSKSELVQYADSAADSKVEEGNALARKGGLREAISLYREALVLNPLSSRAAYNIAFAYEKLGMMRMAVAAYADYLLQCQAKAQDREDVKRRVINLSRGLTPPPPVLARIFGMLDKASALAVGGDSFGALRLYEIAQSVAPWWAEPYYGAGIVYYHLAIQNSFSYADNAIRCLKNFLAAVPPEDARIEAVRKRVKDLLTIKEGLDAPKTVSSY